MQNCKVEITGNVGLSADGKLEIEENGFTLLYEIDGDNCTLEMSGGKVTQTRVGAICIDISFDKDNPTECRYKDAANGIDFSLPVKTDEINFEKVGSGISLKLKYLLGEEPTSLNITALINK